jgi:hypothetical protein
VLVPYTFAAYEAEFDEDPSSWPKAIQQTYFDWRTQDVVWVAELYRVIEEKETIHVYRTIDGREERYTDEELDENDGAKLEVLMQTGARELRQKKIKVRRIHKYLMSGSRILEDCGIIPGRRIPIVPVFGNRRVIDNSERMMGHVRLAKDPQRLKNMQLSSLAEISSLFRVEKPIVTPEQIAGHQVAWRDDNINNAAYLQLNPVNAGTENETPMGPVGFTKVPQVPPALATLIQTTEMDLKDILGNQDQGEKLSSNVSADAVNAVQERLDMLTSLYISNMAKGMHACGEIWLSMAKDLYVEKGRRMKALSEDGVAESVELAKPAVDADSAIYEENDLSRADFDVAVSVGPSTTSRKQAIARTVVSVLPFVPPEDLETRTALISYALQHLEGEGVTPLREWFRKKLVSMGVEKPNEEERREMQAAQQAQQQQPPDPQTQLVLSAAAKEQSLQQKAQAQTMLAVAQTKKTEAETLATVGKLDISARQHAIEAVQRNKELDLKERELNERKRDD